MLIDALPFFDKGPEFIQLALIHVVILEQVFTDLFTMPGCLRKDAYHSVLVKVKDPGAGANSVALGEGFQYMIDGWVIRVETRKDASVAPAQFSATLQAAIKRRMVRPITADQLHRLFNGAAPVGTTQT